MRLNSVKRQRVIEAVEDAPWVDIAALMIRLAEIATSDEESDVVLDEAENATQNLARALALLATAPQERRGWNLLRIEREADAVVAAARRRALAPAAPRLQPVERRAMGLMMRVAERDGAIEAPDELRAIVVASQFPMEELDRGFVLIVTDEGRTVGGTIELDDLDGARLGKLLAAGLIACDELGDWSMTTKGEAMASLLSEYADPRHEWRSLLSDSDQPVVSTYSDEPWG
jgi:hypothetical protein